MKGRKKGEQGFGKDAKEMYKVLTDPNICAIRPENVRLLTDGKGTSENIKKAVVELGYEMKKADEPEVEQSDDDGEDDANNTEKGSEMEEFLQSCVPRDSLLWASSRSYEPSRVEASAEDRVSVFTKYVLTGLRGGDTLLKQRAQAVGGIPLNFLQDYVYTKVTEELAGQTPSICGQAEKTYWMAYPPED
ncbi:Hypp9404 [Branchiostoma lanceolatum]|uniref:Hypp9404 protein n=1 Tax=Branchiostoma lanceolatum TaxID=7740 RepID=A0A8S4MM76_BRALA|nr:Hypp9404 [Branchiostoma lanceolatum]